MFKKIVAFTLVLSLFANSAHAGQLVTVDEFRGLTSNPEPDKTKDGSHQKFDNAFIEDGNIRVAKGRDRLNSTAHGDTVVNMFCYYESSGGTKKLVVKESDEVVTYDTDGTNRTQIASSLTNEKADCEQQGDNLYWNSATDGFYKWTGSGSAAAVGSVSAPSAVDFAATSGAGAMTSGLDAEVVHEINSAGTGVWYYTGSQCAEAPQRVADAIEDNTACGSLSTDFTKTCATSTTYSYKVSKWNSKWGIESEPSSVDTATLTGSNTVSVAGRGCFTTYTSNTCGTVSASACSDTIITITGAQTRTTGTLAAAPSDPFDGYCVYRGTAGSTDLFRHGCVTGGGTAYDDGKPDVALGSPLDTTIDTIAPPSFRYLETYNGVLFTAEGSTINFTRLPVEAATSADTYWLSTDKLLLSSDKIITGMKRTKDSLLIFTGSNIYELTGFGVARFKLKLAAEGIGVVSDETCEVDTQGDVICFTGTQGVYKFRTFAQPQDDLTGSTIDQDRISLIKVSSPDLDDIFLGNSHEGIDLDPADYPSAHAYYDRDNDLYFLYIGNDGFVFDNINQSWTHLPGTKMIGSAYRKSANASGQGVLIDNLGFFYNNWLGYENGIESGTVTGNPTSSTSTTVTDSGATFNTTNDGLKGLWVVIDTAGTLQYRQISSNTGTALTVTSAWTSNPVTTSTYYVGYIVFDIKTKQYTFQKPPKLTEVQAMTIVHNKSASTQNVKVTLYAEKSSTETDNDTKDFSTYNIDKFGIVNNGSWFEWTFRSFVYNTSNTVVPPIDIINYTFRLVPKEDE